MEFHVSVPFPGILFLNIIGNNIYKAGCDAFPSPSRGSYFSIPERRFMKLAEFFESFRPLPGDLISQSIEELLMEKPSMFPSPSRGSYFSIKGQIF